MILLLIITNFLTVVWAAYEIQQLKSNLYIVTDAAQKTAETVLALMKKQMTNDR